MQLPRCKHEPANPTQNDRSSESFRLRSQIEQYGFPRLLLTVRDVLKKQRLDEMTEWLSANKLVEEAVTDFAAHFHKPEQRAFADEVVRSMREFHSSPRAGLGNQLSQKQQPISRIRIRDFRNLHNVQFITRSVKYFTVRHNGHVVPENIV